MLSILGERQGHEYCDGLTRRNFLRIGGLGLGGMSLPDVLRAQDLRARELGIDREKPRPSSRGLSHKAVIMIYLPGGPSHQDMVDLKMGAPSEIRGTFKPIPTNVPGIEICEHMPRLAKMMDKFAIIRSLHGALEQHVSDLCVSGYPRGSDDKSQSGRPSLGSNVSKLQGPVDTAVPPFVGLSIDMNHPPYANPGLPGFLGAAHAAFQPKKEGMADMRLENITADRLGDRKALLANVDRWRRAVDVSGVVDKVDTHTQRAFEVLTSSKFVEAMDLEREHPAIRDRYGRGSPNPAYNNAGGPHWMDQFLLARRLVEAGVRCVTLSFGYWDLHSDNFKLLPGQLAQFDQGLTALVEDIHARGLQDDVSVVAWGEFGRTPRINKGAGRDHWPRVSCALLAGGGMRTGQVIGSTTRFGEEPRTRPVHYQNVFATLYHQLGIDPTTAQVTDQSGRPHYLVEHREPIAELI